MDIFASVGQGMIPYGAQLLAAAKSVRTYAYSDHAVSVLSYFDGGIGNYIYNFPQERSGGIKKYG